MSKVFQVKILTPGETWKAADHDISRMERAMLTGTFAATGTAMLAVKADGELVSNHSAGIDSVPQSVSAWRRDAKTLGLEVQNTSGTVIAFALDVSVSESD